MRLCFISAGSFAHIGSYLDYFKDAGHDVHFLALSPSPPRQVPTHELGLGAGGKWQYAVGVLRARRLVRRLRPDLVHTHYATSGGLAGLVCGFTPTVVTAHGTDLATGASSPARRALLKAVFAQADCVNPVSDELRDLALGLGVDAAKIFVLTLGVDTRRFPTRPPRRRAAGEPLRLICTRRLEAVYDPETIVEALARVKAAGAAFSMTFAGAGELEPRLRELVARRGLAAEVRFLGERPNAELPELLGDHDVYLSASRRDGTSLSLLEAMARGLLPVVSAIAANAAWLRDGEGGLLHRVGDPAHLAERILEARGAPGLLERAARVNAAVVARSGDRTTNMRRLEARYADIIANRQKTCTADIRSKRRLPLS